MSFTSDCPRCRKQVLVPDGACADTQVRCPLCTAEYPLSEVLAAVPPALIVVGLAAPALVTDAAITAIAGAALPPPPPSPSSTESPAELIPFEATTETEAQPLPEHEPVPLEAEAEQGAWGAGWREVEEGTGDGLAASGAETAEQPDDAVDFAAITGGGAAARPTPASGEAAPPQPVKRRRKREPKPVRTVIGVVVAGILALPCADLINYLGTGKSFIAPYYRKIFPASVDDSAKSPNGNGEENGQPQTPAQTKTDASQPFSIEKPNVTDPSTSIEPKPETPSAKTAKPGDKTAKPDEEPNPFDIPDDVMGPKDKPGAEVPPETVKPEPGAKTEPKAEPKTETKPADPFDPLLPEPEPKAEPKVEPKTEPKTETKPADPFDPLLPEPEPKPGAKTEPKAEPKTETKPADPFDMLTPEPKLTPEAKPEAKTEPKAEPKVEPKVEPGTGVEPKPAGPLGPLQAPSYELADLARSFQAAHGSYGCPACNSKGTLLKDGKEVPCDACKGKPSTDLTPEAYEKLRQMAEEVTFVKPGADAAKLEDQKQAVRDLLQQIGKGPQAPQRISALAKQLLDDAASKGGVLIVGTVLKMDVSKEGLHGAAIKTDAAAKPLMVMSDKPLGIQENDQVLLLGSLIREPAKNLGGYTGTKPLVIWAGMPVKLP